MNKSLDNFPDKIRSLLLENRITEAMSQLDAMAELASANWQVKSEISKVRESFGFLRDYALRGVADPQREQMYQDIKSSINQLCTSILRQAKVSESSSLYFGTVRYEMLQDASSLGSVMDIFLKQERKLAMMQFTNPSAKPSAEARELVATHADSQQRLFDLIWTCYPLNGESESRIYEFLSDTDVRPEIREQMLGAVLLGCLAYFDERRLSILARLYLNSSGPIQIKALVTLLLCMWMCRNEITGNRFTAVLDTVKESGTWEEDLKMVFLNLARTRDTERISRTMRDELIPEMMKLRPEILKKINVEELPEDMTSLDINPEWEDMLEKSGIADKLKELNDLQADGGDVMLGTFASLKTFPFFHKPSKWFLPFYTEQADVAEILRDTPDDLGEIIALAPMLCDSDKYSMVLSLQAMPSANRRMMVQQFQAQAQQFAEIRSSLLNPERESRDGIANRYIQDLYRFFTLFRRKGEFGNPFAGPINLASVPLLADSFSDSAMLMAVAEYYFKRHYYSEALDIYKMIISLNQASSYDVLQKAGFCHQKSGDYESALDMYRRSEFTHPDSQWLIRHIAQCYRAMGRYAEAIPYYEKLVLSRPDDASLALTLGHCYLAACDYKGALKYYHRAEYLDEGGTKAWRPIAWCAFVEGDLEKSRKYYDRVLSDNPTAADFLNAGHLSMATKDFSQAVKLYRQALRGMDDSADKLYAAVSRDRDYLLRSGVDDLLISLTLDAATNE